MSVAELRRLVLGKRWLVLPKHLEKAPVDVHASADGQVYMFKRRPNETAASSDDDEISVVEMRPRDFCEQERGGPRNVELLEREVLEGDSLNKLALQYGCKVADLKRMNNLMQEQDLFALKSVKIPVQKHSFLMETFTDINEPQDEMQASPTRLVKPQDRTRAQPHLQEVTDFLMEVDNDIEKLIQTTNDQQEDFSESSGRQQRFSLGGRRLPSSGADWGIQWWNALVAVLLIGIVLPIFYLIYFKTKDNGAALLTDVSGALASATTSANISQST